MAPKTDIGNTLRDIATESSLNKAERVSLRSIAKEFDKLQAEVKRLKESLEQIRDLETDCCPRCEGNGRLYADGKGHLMSENAPTILCGNCGGSGRILPEDAQEIAEQALTPEKPKEKGVKGAMRSTDQR